MREFLSNVTNGVIAIGIFIIGVHITDTVPSLVTGIVAVAVGLVGTVAVGVTRGD